MEAKQYLSTYRGGKYTKEINTLPVTMEEDEASLVENQVINIYPDIPYQTIEGFGGAITESVGYLLNNMDPTKANEVIEEYFGKDGLNYRFIRMHLDSCDYSLEEYQAVADPIADPALETFTIERDVKYAIKWVKKAMEVSPNPISVLVSPWSPPKQWKTPPIKKGNDAATYGALAKLMPQIDYDTPSRCNGGKLKKEHYGDWAKYLIKYIQAYLEAGIPVTMLSIQNESVAATNWDSCVWTAEEQRDFLMNYLHPMMVEAGIRDKIEIFIWDHNKERVLENCRVMIDDETDAMIDGIAYHWYSGDHFDALDLVREKFPNKTMMSSECCMLHPPVSGKLFGLTFEDAKLNLHRASTIEYRDSVAYVHDMIQGLNHGMQRWIDWNICTDKNGGPRHVAMGFANPVVIKDNGDYTNTPIFDALGHIARYITPNAAILATTVYDAALDVTAAKTVDNKIVLVVQNSTDKDKTLNVRCQGQLIKIKAPKRSIQTVVM